ncbi:MAG: hypothetical protein WC728_02885 [Elusimicrobiota bacterium]
MTAAGKPTVKLVCTPLLGVKLVLACAFGAAALYYLNTGKKQADVGRLLWAALFGVLTFLVFAL